MQASFIIPARNEEVLLPRTLAAIREYASMLDPYETIVVDHGSSDRTPTLAKDMGARIVVQRGGTVAAARNRGAKLARASVLIFLDADVRLTPEWGAHIEQVFCALAHDPMTVYGSWVGVSRPPSWIERYWFQPLERHVHSHVNSGHLIVARELFEKLNGFDDHLETGEDYDFSQRAIAAGSSISNVPELAVVHEGYPKTLSVFFRRELWHGRGDWTSLSKALHSRVVVLALVTLTLSVVSMAVVGFKGSSEWALLFWLTASSVCLAAAWKKYWPVPLRVLAVNTALYYVYFVARALAWLPPFFGRKEGRVMRRSNRRT